MITKSGEFKYIELQGVVLPNECVVTIWTDVTRHEIAEAELRESEAKFRILFKQSSDAVLLLHDDTIIDCNHAAEKLFHTVGGNDGIKAHSCARRNPLLILGGEMKHVS